MKIIFIIIIFFITHVINSGTIIFLSKRKLRKQVQAQAQAQAQAQVQAQVQAQAQAQAFGLNYIISNHNAGFFSCCSIRLEQIIDYIHKNKQLPDIVDSRNQFRDYKKKNDQGLDISHHFFKFNKSISIKDIENHTKIVRPSQFSSYKLINYVQITPLINKYFDPSNEIKKKVLLIEQKYNINYEELLTVYYRSTDKYLETNIPSIDTIMNRISEVRKTNPELRILYMTDNLDSIKKIHNQFRNVIIIEEVEKHYHRSYEHAQWFMSSVIVMSKAHSIIMTSGNVSNWMIFYRNNSNNIHQYYSPIESIYEHKNNSYDPNQQDFWL